MLLGSFYKVPFLVPYWNKEELKTILQSIFRGELVEGDQISKFEHEISNLVGVRYVKTMNFGRVAIESSLKGFGLEKGDEVIVPSFVCRSAVVPVIHAGGIPVYADIGEDLNINPHCIEENITDKTRAVIVPHLSGKIADIDEIQKIAKENNLYIIDDAAQAFGAKHNGKYAGTLGDVGIFSIGLGKNMIATTGGILVTDSKEIFDRAGCVELAKERKAEVTKRALNLTLQYRYRKYTHPFFIIGNKILNKLIMNPESQIPAYFRKKMSNLDAALGRIQLSKLDGIIQKRRRNAKILSDCLSDLDQITLPEYLDEHIFTKYIIQFNAGNKSKKTTDRWERLLEFEKFLRTKRIEAEWSYVPLHLREGLQKYKRKELLVTENLWWKLITLPVNPSLGEEQMIYVAENVKTFLRNR